MNIQSFYTANKQQIHFWGAIVVSIGVLYIIARRFVFTGFEDFVKLVFKNEGGFANSKDDRGSFTMYGISSTYNPEYADKIKNKTLTKSEAKSIYKRKYYDPLKIELINDARLKFQVFDMAVNAGKSRAINILKTVLKLPSNTSMTDTVKKANLAQEGGFDVVGKYKQARRDYYKSIAKGTQAQFLKGWLNRVDSDKNLFKT